MVGIRTKREMKTKQELKKIIKRLRLFRYIRKMRQLGYKISLDDFLNGKYKWNFGKF